MNALDLSGATLVARSQEKKEILMVSKCAYNTLKSYINKMKPPGNDQNADVFAMAILLGALAAAASNDEDE